ncbi:apolipoprotein C-I [Micropterus salmoides]|uniref:apolipoprotein C-I n=1 Tax=Micropterus salmoides TaxID=27706 RepID=UPI0018ED53E2|nr:apolipoprotein C-I [Micropterus salmoides]
MRLYLAVAVLVLAFVAYTEAQEETIEQRFSKFGEQMTQFGDDLAEKTKAAITQIQNSDFAVSSRNWFQEQIEKLRNKFGEGTQ